MIISYIIYCTLLLLNDLLDMSFLSIIQYSDPLFREMDKESVWHVL